MKYESPKKQKAYRDLAHEIGKRVVGQARRQGMSVTILAKKAKVSQGSLCRMAARGDNCIQLFGLYKMAAVLDVSIRKILPPGGWA